MKKKTIFIIGCVLVLLLIISIVTYNSLAPSLKINDEVSFEKYHELSEDAIWSIVDASNSQYDSLDMHVLDANNEEISWDDYIKRHKIDGVLEDEKNLAFEEDFVVRFKARTWFFSTTVDQTIHAMDTKKPHIEVMYQSQSVKENGIIKVPSGKSLRDLIAINACDPYYNSCRAIDYKSEVDLDKVGSSEEIISMKLTAADQANNEVTFEFSIEVEETFIQSRPQNESPKPDANAREITGNLHSQSILVNKQNRLPSDFVPTLSEIPSAYAVSSGYYATPNTVNAFISMVDTMSQELGMSVEVTSSYRSYAFQTELYNSYVERNGQAEADRFSAQPGKSEHQTGLALDLVAPGVSMWDFGSTEQARWVRNNAHQFGFILRYPEGKESVTGYMPEAWHIRYFGENLAQSIYDSGLTYEEFLGN